MTDELNPQNEQENADENPNAPQTLEQYRQALEAMNRRLSSLETEKQKANEEAKSRRLELERVRAEAEAERERNLAEQGNFKKLYEDVTPELKRLKSVEERYQTQLEQIRARNQERIKEIPERFSTLIPTDKTPDELQAWLDVNEKILTTPKAPDIDAGARSTGGGKVITAPMPEPIQNLADIARMNGFAIDNESLAKRIKDKQEK